MFWSLLYYEQKYLSGTKPSVKVVKSVRTVFQNRYVGIREITEDLNITTILVYILGMKCVDARLVEKISIFCKNEVE